MIYYLSNGDMVEWLRQRSAKPFTPVRIWLSPPYFLRMLIYNEKVTKYSKIKEDNIYKKYVGGKYGATPRVSLSYIVELYWQKAKNAGKK